MISLSWLPCPMNPLGESMFEYVIGTVLVVLILALVGVYRFWKSLEKTFMMEGYDATLWKGNAEEWELVNQMEDARKQRDEESTDNSI